MTKGLFITSTGTDIGKTYISGEIIKLLRENRVNAGYYKAALSGAVIENEKILECDVLEVLRKCSIKGEINEFVSYVMETPLSPHLASKIENIDINIDKIKSDFEKIKEKYDYITVEGSGGIICPLNIEKNLMLIDIIKELNLDILVVAKPVLGSINSTVLTIEYAKNHGINVKGIILNEFDKESILHRDNKEVIENITGIPVIDCVEENKGLNIDTKFLCSLYKEME